MATVQEHGDGTATVTTDQGVIFTGPDWEAWLVASNYEREERRRQWQS